MTYKFWQYLNGLYPFETIKYIIETIDIEGKRDND